MAGRRDSAALLADSRGKRARVRRGRHKVDALESATGYGDWTMRALGTLMLLAAALSAQGAGADTPHWAFKKPRRPEVPRLGSTWVRNPIDAFVLARLDREGLRPAPPADRHTLLRRVHLDLTGLLPTPAEVEAFVRDTRPDAYERVVDSLLASPHYGERQARHWLDAARYADSNGYSVDSARSIWPYRDWVIRAYNEDLPFDRFTTEQMAGDLLPDATDATRTATGFHRNTMRNEEGGVDPEEFRIEAVKDRVSTVATVWLGLSLGCAQCHDHKYDPLLQADFYGLYAFLNNDDEPELLLGPPARRRALSDWQEREKQLKQRVQRAKKSADADVLGRAQAELRSHRQRRPRVDRTLVLAARAEPRVSHLHIKGDFTRKGRVVRPSTPAALHPLHSAAAVPTRLDLARWLVSPDNPLTSRVTVNRLWQRCFGRGLVATENDFGTRGERPTHPALLDWLATEFVANGWRRKPIHRLIVTSATYRQSSYQRIELVERDPTNRLLARQTRLRLDAEVIRDAALCAAGVLDPRIGGPGVFPPQADGVMQLGQMARSWKPSAGGNRFRRGLYTFFWRATPHPALRVFDAPSAVECCTRRRCSNTPLQALTLLNGPAFVELAQHLAKQLFSSGERDDARIDCGFARCVGRPPSLDERRVVHGLLDARPTADSPSRWLPVARVLLNLDEFITRE
ncbi:MAG: DUF1553 domain-containing protein [Planctomycetes bacterium]|nr:DUF1553 domain-containing protein [Planctomycetota bacterium]